MEDHVYRCDGPVPVQDAPTLESFRRAESEIEAAADQIMAAAADLPSLLWGPLTVDRVRHWVAGGVSDLRTSLFGTSVWGTIRWDRALGRPSTPRLADAFSFDHWYLWVEVIDTGGQPIVKESWIKQPAPRVWDGPHDDESYRVGFMMRGVPGLVNRFWPAMRSPVPWEPPFPAWSSTRRGFVWPENMLPFGTFTIAQEEVLVLDEYRVIKRF
jgi:hypothetical protein